LSSPGVLIQYFNDVGQNVIYDDQYRVLWDAVPISALVQNHIFRKLQARDNRKIIQSGNSRSNQFGLLFVVAWFFLRNFRHRLIFITIRQQ
jgi:hypothetical protein